jgi:hypothetical protein
MSDVVLLELVVRQLGVLGSLATAAENEIFIISCSNFYFNAVQLHSVYHGVMFTNSHDLAEYYMSGYERIFTFNRNGISPCSNSFIRGVASTLD